MISIGTCCQRYDGQVYRRYLYVHNKRLLFLPYVPFLESKVSGMRKFNVDVRFTYNNKIENRLCRNKTRDGSLDGFGVYKIS